MNEEGTRDRTSKRAIAREECGYEDGCQLLLLLKRYNGLQVYAEDGIQDVE